MNRSIENQRHPPETSTNVYFEVGMTGADTSREPAEGLSTTGAGSFPRALRTDSVNRGSSISLFTLESVVLALFAGPFFFCIVK
jgi:hypothetical protein